MSSAHHKQNAAEIQTIPPPHGVSLPAEAPPRHAAEHAIPARSLVRNSMLIMGFQGFTKLLGLVSSILLANHLGTELFGVYNYAFAMTLLFMPLCDLGIDIYLMKEIPRQSLAQSQQQFGIVLVGKVALGAAVLGLMTVAGLLFESFGHGHLLLVLLAGVINILRTFWVSFSAVLRSINQVSYEASLFSVTRLSECAVLVFCISTGQSLTVLLTLLTVINAVAVGGTYLTISKRFLPPQWRGALREFATVFRGGLPFAVSNVLVAISFNLDTVLISKIIGNEAAGIYRASYNLIIPLMMVTVSISGAVFPFVSQKYRQQPTVVVDVVRQSASWLLMLGIPIAVFGWLTADDIVRCLFASTYAGSGTILAILVWFVPVVYLTNLFGCTLGAIDQQSYVLKVIGMNVLFNITANLILIPRYAQTGAAIVMVCTEALGLMALWWKTRTFAPGVISGRLLLQIMVASVPALAFFYVTPLSSPFYNLPIAVVLYGTGLFGVGALSWHEFTNLMAWNKGREA